MFNLDIGTPLHWVILFKQLGILSQFECIIFDELLLRNSLAYFVVMELKRLVQFLEALIFLEIFNQFWFLKLKQTFLLLAFFQMQASLDENESNRLIDKRFVKF